MWRRHLDATDPTLLRLAAAREHYTEVEAICDEAKHDWRAEALVLRAQVAALLAAGQAYRERGHDNTCDTHRPLFHPALAWACNCGKAQLDAAFDAAKGTP